MNIEKHIAHNALQLVVNKNDPTLFDNPEIFEKNLIENGALNSDEVEALKQSLTLRLPWEIRKYSKNLNAQVIKDLANNFAQKSKVDAEMAAWVVETWMAVLGLKFANTQQSSNTVPQKTTNDNANKNVAPDSKPLPQTTTTVLKANELATVPFEQVKGRLGIVFGEDSSGEVKVFNTWYNDNSSSENSSLSVTPVKLESEPVKPFKTAPKRKKIDRVALAKKIQNNTTTTEKPVDNSYNHFEKVVKQQEYKPTPLEQKAYDLLKKGSIFANEALKILAPIAVAGSVLACRKMGEVYYRGYGVVQNFQAAHAWLKLSAEKEDAESLFLMGTLYQFGMGVKQDTVQAKQFFERAARQGHTKSIESLKIISMGV